MKYEYVTSNWKATLRIFRWGERDFSLCPAFLLESGHCNFPSSDKWGWGARKKLQCCCAENEQCHYCGGELIQWLRTLLLNTSFCMQKPGGQKHMCAVSALWSAPVDFLGVGEGIQAGPNRYFRTLLLSNNGVWWSHQRSTSEWYSQQPSVRSSVVTLRFV